MQKRITALGCVFMFIAFILFAKIFLIVRNPQYYSASRAQGMYTLNTGTTLGNIYDRSLNLLVNEEIRYYAAVNPSAEAAEEILPYVTDKESFYENIVHARPFVCEVTEKEIGSGDISVFEVPRRYGRNQLAQHVVGYIGDNGGVTGIEYAYSDYLNGCAVKNSVTYNVDGYGRVLGGFEKQVDYAEQMTEGVVLTIDKEIQRICENAGKKMEKGAVVVLDIYSGDILAMASFPSYSVETLGNAVSDENSPLINRSLYAYNVGSVFKLVTALCAFEQGIDESFCYECTGSTEVGNQVFRCHNLGGHGNLDMKKAMAESCNTYFIELCRQLDAEAFLETARRLGFGQSIPLTVGMTASGGTLQTIEDMTLPAEKANLSFGQGKLTATPLQVCAMTAAIANEGTLYVPRLILGTTDDGKDVIYSENGKHTQVFDRLTAFRLQDLMIEAVDKSAKSKARPCNTNAAGKTSTAQTGRYDENGEEICHGWITGYFPLSHPKYAVTVLCEDGGYGNECAAPVFREIAEKITESLK